MGYIASVTCCLFYSTNKMDLNNKTKDQLLEELTEMRQRIIELGKEVSDHKRTDEEYSDIQEHIHAIYNSSKDGIGYASPENGVFLDLNESFLKITGYSKEELVAKKTVNDITPPEYHDFESKKIDELLRTGEPQEYEKEYIKKDGSHVPVMLTIFTLKNSRGKLLSIAAMIKDITDRKIAMVKLKESEEKYRQIVSTSTDAIMLFDADTRQFLDVNKACECLYGYSKEEFLKLKHDYITDEPEESKSSIDETLNGKIEKISLRYHKKKDGTVFPVEISVSHFKMEDQRVLCGIVRDSTERKQAEKRIKETQILLESSIESPKDMTILSIDNQYRYLYFNKVHKEVMLSAYKKDVKIGMNILDCISDEDDRAKAKINFDRALAGENHVTIQEYGELERAYYETSYNSIIDDKNEIIGATVFAKNITERIRTEKKLKESEEQYRSLVETSQDLIWKCDAEGRFIYLNPAWEKVLGYKLEEMLGHVFNEFQSSYVIERDSKEFESHLEGGSVTGHETTYLSKSGKEVNLIFNAVPLFDDEGKIVGTQGTSSDITERKRTEEELQKMQKIESVGVLAGGIAHDFNNLLAAIRNNIYLSMLHMDREDKAYESLETTEKIIQRATNLTQQLLTFSKGGAPIKKTASIIELINESAEFVLKGSSVKCEYNISDNSWPIEVDEGQISQVIHNLILNAAQSMPQGGAIRISTENSELGQGIELPLQEGRYVKIAIQDQGIGISKEHLKSLFDPYFTTKEMGRGLGLSVVYSIIKKHDGHISVESELGVGTTFTIYLPASEKQVEAKESIEDTFDAGDGKILLMDDEEIIRESVEQLLTHKGYEIECAKDGDEAIELYKKAMEASKPFNAVILDLTIRGGMGGKETVKKLLEIDPNVKAIVASGYSNDPVLANFKEYGFVGVFAKHDKAEELGKTLHQVINGY